MKLVFIVILFLGCGYKSIAKDANVNTASVDTACVYNIEKSSVKLKWTAYKTTEKIAVSGSFKKNNWSSKPASTINDLVKSLKFKIETDSVDSNSWVRDKRIFKYFFKKMINAQFIQGQGVSFQPKEKKSTIEIIMNGQKTPIVFETKITDDHSFELLGEIDVLKNFKMNTAYKSISKACEKLHAGADGVSKTWTNVGLSITGKMSKFCR